MKELLETLIRKANTKNGSGKTQDNQSPSESFFFFTQDLYVKENQDYVMTSLQKLLSTYFRFEMSWDIILIPLHQKLVSFKENIVFTKSNKSSLLCICYCIT